MLHSPIVVGSFVLACLDSCSKGRLADLGIVLAFSGVNCFANVDTFSVRMRDLAVLMFRSDVMLFRCEGAYL